MKFTENNYSILIVNINDSNLVFFNIFVGDLSNQFKNIIMCFNSKIMTSYNTSLFIEIYYITSEGTVFQFHDFVDNATNEMNQDSPDKVRFNWAWEENVKVKVNQLISKLSKKL